MIPRLGLSSWGRSYQQLYLKSSLILVILQIEIDKNSPFYFSMAR